MSRSTEKEIPVREGRLIEFYFSQTFGRIIMRRGESSSAVEIEIAHKPLEPESPAAQRARFFNSADAFNVVLEPVPDKVFSEEPLRALSSECPSGYIPCNSFGDSQIDYPSTSPLILASYVRINKGEKLMAPVNTVVSICYVIEGRGKATVSGQEIQWKTGDVFVLPGGEAVFSGHDSVDTVLWLVTNEPQMRFENTRPLDFSETNIEIVHYPSEEIERQILRVTELDKAPETAGIAVVFSSEKQLDNRNVSPTLTLAMNTLPPHDFQRAHRHNSVAVSLVVQGEDCFSMIDGRRKAWAPWATTVTPPLSLHSHHNEGNKQARFLIVQDGGIYYHARTMGFSFE